jgi:hypothetical protein
MSDETQARRGYGLWVAVGVLVPVVYVLALGPVAAVVKATGRGRDAARAIYAPLIWLSEAVPPIQVPLRWYERLWTGG